MLSVEHMLTSPAEQMFRDRKLNQDFSLPYSYSYRIPLKDELVAKSYAKAQNLTLKRIQLWNSLSDKNHHKFMMQSIDHVQMPASGSSAFKGGFLTN